MTNLIKTIAIFLSIFSFLSLSRSWAADSDATESTKQRNYIGGADESDLKVQTTLPVYKKNKNEANIEEEVEEGF